jgi:uncharacterized circularly permuted ATP-grasp superfamily protein/uncharacterized alpha-E superfamily protein
MPEPAADEQLEPLLATYTVPTGHFDELLDASGSPRPWWRSLAAHADLSAAHLSAAYSRIARQIHDDGVTYNVYAAEDGPSPWALDVVPFLVPAAEWSELAPGLRQRARLLNAVAADLYGPQRLLREGLMPPALAFNHPGYLRPCCGVRPPAGVFIHLVAFDLARDASGSWRVVNTRAQAPSGAGYALENRTAVPRTFPGAFRDLHVERLAPFFQSLKDSIIGAAPCDEPSPHVVLLTPGPYNETYFEHSYLARHLGFPLVEGADLAVRHDRVFLKTISGLRQVHAIVRRLDDDYCDPLELRSDSTLGVPGLVQAWRSGRVLVANAFGTSVVESPALLGVLPAACERLLGERLESAAVSTRWPCNAAVLDVAAGAGSEAATRGGGVIKPAFPNVSMEPVFLSDLDAVQRQEWANRLSASPGAYVVEERLPLSHAPTWHDGRFEGRALMLRVFLAADGHGDYILMPGGLSRIAGDARPIVSTQRGGSSKDTWVLSDPHTALGGARRVQHEHAVQIDAGVSSRAAEHLFWLGRYAERAESTARLLRAVLARLTDPASQVAFHPLFLRACLNQGLLDPADALPDADFTTADSTYALSLRLVDNLFDRRTRRSLGYNVDQTVRAAGAVRGRLSPDNWRLLRQLLELVSPPSRTPVDFDDALALVDQAIVSLVAVGGLEMAHMTRDDGWRFLSVGRHLERLTFVASSLEELTPEESADHALLEWLLELSDSLLTFRARYARQPDWPAVVELLVFDARNPRSVLFQLAKIAKHVAALPGVALDAMADIETLERACRADNARQGELFGHVPIDQLLGDCLRAALKLSDGLSLRYFSHAYELAHATGAR